MRGGGAREQVLGAPGGLGRAAGRQKAPAGNCRGLRAELSPGRCEGRVRLKELMVLVPVVPGGLKRDEDRWHWPAQDKGKRGDRVTTCVIVLEFLVTFFP